MGGRAHHEIEALACGIGREIAKGGQQQSFAGNDPKQAGQLVAHRHQGRVLRQVVTHVGIEHLIDDHAANDESHGGPEREDEADGGAGAPVVLLEINKALLGEHLDVAGQLGLQTLGDGGGIASGLQANQADLDAPGRGVGKQIDEGLRAGQQISIRSKGGSQAHQTSHADALAGNFTLHRAPLTEPLGHRSKFRSGLLIKKNPPLLSQRPRLWGQRRIGEEGIIGLKAQGQDGACPPRLGVAPEQQIPVNRRDPLHLWGRHGLDHTALGEAGHAHRTGGPVTDQHQIGVKQPVNRDAGIKQPVTEAQLHEHQDPGETDARKRYSETDWLPG